MIKHRRKDYQSFHFNEIRPGVCDLIQDAIAGKYNYDVYKPRWISREEFELKKESDPMIKIIWSFGNNGKNYLFGKDIEQQKRSMHMAIVFNEFDQYSKDVFGIDSFKDGYGINEKRLYLKARIKYHGMKRLDLEQLQQLERLQQLQQLQQLAIFSNKSYEQVEIKPGSMVYCDIPYGGTAEYDKSSTSFNRKAFFDWADSLAEPVYISEYNVEDSRFKCIANFKKRSLLSSDKGNGLVKAEKVYVNKVAYKQIFQGRK